MAYDEVKRAFIDHFRKVEDPDKLWHTIQGLVQGEEQDVDAFLKQFNELWERWCVALDEEAPSTMLKKDRFLSSLKSSLRWKVELKQPHSFEEAVEMAKNKEWKIKRLIQLGIKEKSEVEVKIVNQPKVLVRETIPGQEEHASHAACNTHVGGTEAIQKDTHEMIGMMKNLSLNMMSARRRQGYGYGRGYETVDVSTG